MGFPPKRTAAVPQKRAKRTRRTREGCKTANAEAAGNFVLPTFRHSCSKLKCASGIEWDEDEGLVWAQKCSGRRGGPAKSETPPTPFRGVGGAVDYDGAGHRLSPGGTRSLEAGTWFYSGLGQLCRHPGLRIQIQSRQSGFQTNLHWLQKKLYLKLHSSIKLRARITTQRSEYHYNNYLNLNVLFRNLFYPIFNIFSTYQHTNLFSK